MNTMRDPSEEIMRELEARNVRPAPRWHFLLKRSVFWSLAIASILIGAMALSVAFYIFFDREGLPLSALLESPIEEVLEGAPILWLLVFGLFVLSAYLGIRRTKHGYRYETLKTVGLLLLVTLALGLVLAVVDFGSIMHYLLFSDMSLYQALERSISDPQ